MVKAIEKPSVSQPLNPTAPSFVPIRSKSVPGTTRDVETPPPQLHHYDKEQEIDTCGARPQDQMWPRTENHEWVQCQHCKGTISHPPLECPQRICDRCCVAGHYRHECPRTTWLVPYPEKDQYSCPMPFLCNERERIMAPTWAKTAVSPRILGILYQLRVPSSTAMHLGRPVRHRL